MAAISLKNQLNYSAGPSLNCSRDSSSLCVPQQPLNTATCNHSVGGGNCMSVSSDKTAHASLNSSIASEMHQKKLASLNSAIQESTSSKKHSELTKERIIGTSLKDRAGTCVNRINISETCNSNRPRKLADFVFEDFDTYCHLREGDSGLTSQASTSHYQSAANSFFNGGVEPNYVQISDANCSAGESSAIIETADTLGELGEGSVCRVSISSDASDGSSSSSFCSGTHKPHKANDSRWEAIKAARSRDGVLGLSHFVLLKRLGSGDIGSVYLSELSGTRNYFALKVMDKETLASRKKLFRAQTEREILQSLDHPFLPTLYSHIETDKYSCLVMEFCPGGDLHVLRQRQPGRHFSEEAARFYVAEVLLALEYLHMLGIVYRDLKPENVLVRDDGHIMLSDFDLSLRCTVSPTLVKSSNKDTNTSNKNRSDCGQPSCTEPTCIIQSSCIQPTCFGPRILSRRSKKERKKERKAKLKNEVCNQVSPLPELIAEPTSARSMSFVGTHEYLAPEIIKGEGHGSAVDWWTFGIFLYELLFGNTPFKGSGNRATLFNVVGQPLRFPESPTVSVAARDLIKGLLVKEPQQRLAYRRGATELKKHPFFQCINWALIRCACPPQMPKPLKIDFPAKVVPTAVMGGKVTGVDIKPSGNYLEIDFF